MFYVYVIRSAKTGRRYVGSCKDTDDRLHRHSAGHSLATRHGIPGRLTYRETFAGRSEAVARERYFKTGKGRSELDANDV